MVLSMETGNGIYANVPIPEWNAAVFRDFPALPTNSVIYKLLLSSNEKDICSEVERALTSDIYMTVAWIGKQRNVGVAVSNAIDEALAAADFVTESNDMDGVARYIEKYLLS